MILVDSSVWIDHFHTTDQHLIMLLESDHVGCHPYIIEELALGSIPRRADVLDYLSSFRRFPVLSHSELLTFVAHQRLWSRGLSSIDAHLLGSVTLELGAQLWTRDKRLRAAAADVAGTTYQDG